MSGNIIPLVVFLIVLCIFAVLAACNSNPAPPGDTPIEQRQNYAIKTIDGCEYIEVDMGVLDGRVYSLTHKGDCKNPIHQHGH